MPEDAPVARRVRRVVLAVHRLRTGGIGRYILTLAREMTRRGNFCHVVVTEEAGDWLSLARTMGIPVTFVGGMETRRTTAHVKQVAGAMIDLRPDVVIVNHARHALLGLGLLPRESMVFPFVHADDHAAYDGALGNAEQWDCALAPSPKVEAGIARRIPEARRACVLHGIEIPPALPDPDPRRDDSTFRLLYLGRLDRGKGLELLPAIVASLRQRGLRVELDVVGEGPQAAALVSASAGMPIRLVGARGPEQTSTLLRRSHALLLPSESEGLPLTLLEAQAEGCVPVATLLPGSTDIAVANGRSGLLLPREVSPFAEAITGLALDRDHWSNLSRGGRAYAEAEFSAERMGDRYEALFARIEAERRSPRRGGLDHRLFAPSDYLPAPLRRVVRAFRERPAEVSRRS